MTFLDYGETCSSENVTKEVEKERKKERVRERQKGKSDGRNLGPVPFCTIPNTITTAILTVTLNTEIFHKDEQATDMVREKHWVERVKGRREIERERL